MTEQAWNHQYVKANGIRMHYVRQGAGTPIVLLHGWPEFWLTWEPVMRRLARASGSGRGSELGYT